MKSNTDCDKYSRYNKHHEKIRKYYNSRTKTWFFTAVFFQYFCFRIGCSFSNPESELTSLVAQYFVQAVTFSKKSATDIKDNKLLEKARSRNALQDCFYCLTGNMKYRYYIGSLSKRNINSISILDRVARFLFPVSFALTNAVYWSYYAIAEDNNSHQPYLWKSL